MMGGRKYNGGLGLSYHLCMKFGMKFAIMTHRGRQTVTFLHLQIIQQFSLLIWSVKTHALECMCYIFFIYLYLEVKKNVRGVDRAQINNFL